MVICHVILHLVILPKHQRMYDVFYATIFVHGSVLIVRSNQNLFQKRMDAYSCYAYKTSEHFLLRESGNSFFPTRIMYTTHNLVFLKVIIRLSSHSQDLHWKPISSSQSILSCDVRGCDSLSFPFRFSCMLSCGYTIFPVMDCSHTLQEHCSVQTPLWIEWADCTIRQNLCLNGSWLFLLSFVF